jgi:type I restriction enzyme S subunit
VLYGIRASEDELSGKGSGSTFDAITGEVLRSHCLWLAPLGEQRRIVAEIEKQFSRLDAGVVALKRVQAELKRYRAAVLQAACVGRLVPTEAELARAEGRDYESADGILARLQERANSRHSRRVAARTGETSPAVLRALPEGWRWATVGQVADLVTKGSSPGWQGFSYQESGVPFLRSQNVRWGRLDLGELAFLPQQFNDAHPTSIIREDDVLLNLVGASVGRSAVANHQIDGANSNQAVGIIRLAPDGVVARFLMIGFLSPYGQHHIGTTKADVARANFNLDDIQATPVPVPPFVEQQRIVAEVERRLSVIEELDTAVAANLKRAERLRQSILKRAFEGKLVPQDPDDEPASTLLERIRAERTASADGNGASRGQRPRRERPAQPVLEFSG